LKVIVGVNAEIYNPNEGRREREGGRGRDDRDSRSNAGWKDRDREDRNRGSNARWSDRDRDRDWDRYGRSGSDFDWRYVEETREDETSRVDPQSVNPPSSAATASNVKTLHLLPWAEHVTLNEYNEMAEWLTNINARGPEGKTILHVAARSDRTTKLMQFLVRSSSLAELDYSSLPYSSNLSDFLE
jgi:hypothetical protein